MTKIICYRHERNPKFPVVGPVPKFSVRIPSDFSEKKIESIIKKRIREGRAERGLWDWAEGGNFTNRGRLDLRWVW